VALARAIWTPPGSQHRYTHDISAATAQIPYICYARPICRPQLHHWTVTMEVLVGDHSAHTSTSLQSTSLSARSSHALLNSFLFIRDSYCVCSE
jgi:hypothetical protein